MKVGNQFFYYQYKPLNAKKKMTNYILSIVNNYEEDLRNIKERKIFLKEVKQQTPELCLAGVKACAWNILYIKKLINSYIKQ